MIDVTAFLIDMDRDFKDYNAYAKTTSVGATRTTIAISALPTPIAVEFKVVARAPVLNGRIIDISPVINPELAVAGRCPLLTRCELLSPMGRTSISRPFMRLITPVPTQTRRATTAVVVATSLRGALVLYWAGSGHLS